MWPIVPRMTSGDATGMGLRATHFGHPQVGDVIEGTSTDHEICSPMQQGKAFRIQVTDRACDHGIEDQRAESGASRVTTLLILSLTIPRFIIYLAWLLSGETRFRSMICFTGTNRI